MKENKLEELVLWFNKTYGTDIEISDLRNIFKANLLICFTENQTEEMCIEAIKQSGDSIKYIKDKEKYIKMFNIKFIQEPKIMKEVIAIQIEGEWRYTIGRFWNLTKTELIKEYENILKKLSHDGLKLKEQSFQTNEMCMYAVTKNGLALKDVEVQTPEICIKAVSNNGAVLKDIKWDECNFTNEQRYILYLNAVKNLGKALKYISINDMKCYLSEKEINSIYKEAVEENGLSLRFIENQTEELCIDAIRENPDAFKYVKNRTPKICMEVVKISGEKLKHIKNQTEEICKEAVKQNGFALKFVKEQTPELCLIAVKQNGLALEFVKEQTEEICIEAIRQNRESLKYVKNQTQDILTEVIKKREIELQIKNILKYSCLV
ncbi:DUF4116 domain-containing protein [Clostridioides difficile]|uniref:DUF4116 domain-containing protein n=1 Tax=Clostridioides difficile TaxID=1496 RepID=UPI000BB17C38|nr:DUF4116 domain-containing protein [Clostridioides difficile]PBF93492.1 hypothetical protein BGV00_19035 [Clostridioides difficile]